jgi:hypothetical protein
MKRSLPLILRAVLILLGVVLVVAIVADVSGLRTEDVLASVHGIDIWADNSSPRQYFADVAAMGLAGNNTASYKMSHVGNTIQIELFYVHWVVTKWEHNGLYIKPHEVEDTIALGSDFVSGVNYTVKANNVTVIFVAQASS